MWRWKQFNLTVQPSRHDFQDNILYVFEFDFMNSNMIDTGTIDDPPIANQNLFEQVPVKLDDVVQVRLTLAPTAWNRNYAGNLFNLYSILL